MSRRVWTIIVCGGAIMALAVGYRQSLGLFLAPVSVELGGGRESFALGVGLMNLVWGAAAPLTGAVADRWGAGRVAAAGGVAYAAGLAALALSGGGGQLILGGVLIGIGLSGCGFTAILGAVGRAAPVDKRSLALGIASTAGSVGQFLALPFANALIVGHGWRTALIVLAATALMMVPLAAGLAGRAGGADPAASDGVAPGAPSGQTVREAFAEARAVRSFWLLTTGFFVCGFHLAFIAVHLPAFLADRGFPPWLAATALTLVGIANIAGSYACGALGGRFPKKTLLSWLYLARAAIFLIFLLFPVTETTVLVFSVAIGLLWLGTVPLTSGLVAHMFGPTYLSMLFGIVFMGHQLGGFLGAWLAGVLYDAVGSYDVMWWLCIALGLGSAALHWPIAEKPVPRLAAA